MEETTKKTTTRKKTTSSRVTAKQSPKPVIGKDELIQCINVFAGQTILEGKKTKGLYVWNGIGDIQEVAYEDLRMEITNRNSTYIYNPIILIEDDRVIESFPALGKFYEELEAPGELENIIKCGSAETLRAFVEKQPKGMKAAIRSLAADLIQSGELDSISKIKVIDEVLGTKLIILAS
ncbi:hypothetical protein [Ileibacterium valens]|uniref:hypothetical protein n=1 Tax=Ileibacterium valens TaxID=1862668 RepID=UPI00272FCD61|nr:hypothetical protein [Ileibacterium valens]